VDHLHFFNVSLTAAALKPFTGTCIPSDSTGVIAGDRLDAAARPPGPGAPVAGLCFLERFSAVVHALPDAAAGGPLVPPLLLEGVPLPLRIGVFDRSRGIFGGRVCCC
jgi:hypothetical protein